MATNIIEQLKWRYATKKFDSNKILTKQSIEQLKEAFNLTATSYGLQPVTLVIVKDKEQRKDLLPHSWNQQQVVDASHLLIFCVEEKLNPEYIQNYFKRVKTIRNTPDTILKPFEEFLLNSFEEQSSAEIRTWATNQAYLALGNLLTVCAAKNIDACPMEGFNPKEYDRILGLNKKGLTSVLLLPVGYRDKSDFMANEKKVRKTMDEVIIEL
ncbi:NAD(P)H-dependent oxidoreductase [Marixanthomonas sp. SCSIO 43207]|uniref:NAD(P)H-dependent oxidoreductase n=1 Tax=Marixanthomonas sp. SCSIO 43207 TaxID=2779360 RepID=UPI001CA898A7|nr:NAD(P)H-dependent oxidoreductase [Marixanthomonas sp. SCSIO 43207]UAB80957.1 NAD(P)H-dependent oxidoreductase [Marixanthomonas sp. SCSIO 43207]